MPSEPNIIFYEDLLDEVQRRNIQAIPKWMFIAALYEVISMAYLRLGRMITRKEFVQLGIMGATTPEGWANLAIANVPIRIIPPAPNEVVQMPRGKR